MSLRPRELALIADELTRELAGGVVQKVYAPTTTRVYLEVRVPGRSVLLHVCCDPGVARLSVVEARPVNPPQPPAWQSVLRRELTGLSLADAEALPERRTVLLHFSRPGLARTLILEVGAPAIALCTGDAKVLCQSVPPRAGLRVGRPWTPVEAAPAGEAPSRLAGDHVALRLAHAAEALLATAEQKGWVDARRAPLTAKLKRLERTMEKVRAEAERSTTALRYRREGELLTQHLHRLVRGERTVRLTEYREDGSMEEVEVALEPRRTPKEEVAWRFHQYRRLLRGAEIARERLATLAVEAEALRQQLATLDAAPPEAPPLEVRRKKVQGQAPLPPYREYVGTGGQRLWVGRGAAHNDALTFHVARPFHLWLHARGVPGAHVVVPLEKNASLSSEVLIDAAHLALHHSDLKGEPRGEVSYVPVKFVRKAGAPGAVTYTREKTIMLVVEPARLQRLLASAGDA